MKRARDGLGRWSSADPIGLAGGGNLYLYAAANPVKVSDVAGLSPAVSGDDWVGAVLTSTALREPQAERFTAFMRSALAACEAMIV